MRNSGNFRTKAPYSSPRARTRVEERSPTVDGWRDAGGRMRVTSQLNVQMTEQGKELLDELRSYYGLTQRALLEMLVRQEAQRVGLEVPVPQAVPAPPARRGRPRKVR